MKIATDINQSKNLYGILPMESADMYYPYFGGGEHAYGSTPRVGEGIEFSGGNDIRSWSLSALLEVLPKSINVDGEIYVFHLNRGSIFGQWSIEYGGKRVKQHGTAFINTYVEFCKTGEHDNAVDACVEMIIFLKENNLL